MEQKLYDLYFRTLPSNLTPERTPFTRSGRHDAGHLFIYTTNRWRRWSLLLDKTHRDSIYEEALQHIPRGIFQLWLVEKRYSTQQWRGSSSAGRLQKNVRLDQSDSTSRQDHLTSADRPLVVLREPLRDYAPQGDVLSYHLQEADAIAAAEAYTRRCHRRALVGMVLWDEMWIRP